MELSWMIFLLHVTLTEVICWYLTGRWAGLCSIQDGFTHMYGI